MVKFYNDDALNVQKYVSNNTVDLIIFDPPYGIGKNKMQLRSKKWEKSSQEWDHFDTVEKQYRFYKKILVILLPLLNKTGSIFVFGTKHNIFLIGEILQSKLNCKIINSIVWNKTNAMFNVTQSSLIEGTEYIIWACPENNKYYFDYKYTYEQNDKQLRNVWSSPSVHSHSKINPHPHHKPPWLIERLINMACPKNGNILDPMSGSGITALMSHAHKKNCVSIEKNKIYYDQSIESFRKNTADCFK